MVSYIKPGADPKERLSVGSVYTRISVANYRDLVSADEHLIEPDKVRRIEVARVLVDTGATTLSLPRDLIATLGLPLKSRAVAETAAGPIDTEIYESASLTVEGRTANVECLALPEGSQPLLGVIPLEIMGLERDLVDERLRVLPDSTRGSYIRA
jgi:predicted aspartyl protease